jgi:hypothetical protein
MDDKNKWLDAGIKNMLKDPAYAKANATIVKNLLPQKMSAVLLDFAKPLLDITDLSNEAATRSAVMVAVAIWNYSIISDENTPSNTVIDRLDKKAITATIEDAFRGYIGDNILTDLLNRKKSLYPENRRFIGDFDLNWNKSRTEFHLTVLCANV